MMTTKTLFLLRHAKSSWKDSRLDDRERPWNARGRDAATRVGQLLHIKHFAIDLVLCSTSARTRATASLVFAEASVAPAISFRDDLYHATTGEIADILKQVPERTSCVMVIAHNPGLEEFLAKLTGNQVPFPTAALAQIELELDTWNQLADQTRGRLIQLWRPREQDAD